MTNLNPKSCTEKPSHTRLVVARTCKSIAEIISKYKKRLFSETRQVLERSKCRDCGHLIGRCNFDLLKSGQRFSFITTKRIYAGLFCIFFILLMGLALILIRRYNHTYIYGSGSCKSGIFWTYNDCIVMA
ncbi:uncharacterized protein LOC108658185 [Drosophila navojoa]|uniref:uncharacterized protein LOC108658185 n=1 Tax=Drosophila navojoa TaxID=7232 RepID=UPI000847518B|nr:uncharacterized protein LOC108658185 [Drosophila navojoa]